MSLFNYLPTVKHADVQLLMQQPEFYTESIQGLLREGAMDKIQAVFTGTEGFSTLILAVQKLSRLEITGSSDIMHGDLDRHTWEMTLAHITSVVEGNPVCIELIGRMLTAVMKTHINDKEYQPQDMSDMPSAFTLLHLLSCARRLRAACDSIKDDDVKQAFVRIINAFLALPPRQWVPLFASVETVVFLLRFIGREDLKQAHVKFEEENKDVFKIDPELKKLFSEAREIYKTPLINMKKNITNLTNLDIKAKLAERKKVPSAMVAGCPFKGTDWAVVVDVSISAAECMAEKYKIPMLPHHTQLLTLLMFGIQLCRGSSGSGVPKTMLARVGTGEGKSWIIAMLAAFAGKKGLKAHVVIDNKTLLDRDYAAMKKFFDKLNISVKKGVQGFSEKHDVVYCSAQDIESHFSEKMRAGEGNVNFKNCVMIVDEVDSLIVDDSVFQQYVYDDPGGTEFIQWYQDQGKHDTAEQREQWMQTWHEKLVRKLRKLSRRPQPKWKESTIMLTTQPK
jgi:hypothetical protein